MNRKIRPLHDEPTWLNKIGTAVIYLVLGWLVARSEPFAVGNLLSLFLLLGIVAWALILRRKSVKYFVRFHLVQALLLNVSIAAVLWLLTALLDLIGALPGLSIIGEYILLILFQPMMMANLVTMSVMSLLIMTLSTVLAVYAIQGKYVELPWITDGVRNWL